MSSASLCFVRRLQRLLAAVIAAIGLVTACGGGVDTGGTGAPVQTYSAGRISGFGSIVVNGVHFDESAAVIVDDEGVSHPRSALKLGMVVNIVAGPVTVDPQTKMSTSTASRIEFGSEIKGPVESVNLAAGTLVVLGQIVTVDLDTVFSGLATGLASVQAGQLLEVFAFYDASTGVYAATRVELETSLEEYELRGRVENLNTGAKTFTIGGAEISYGALPALQVPELADDAVIRIEFDPAPQGGHWVAGEADTDVPEIPEGVETEVEGIVTDFVSAADFKVNGIAVDGSGDVKFTGGNSHHLANGVQVEIEGETHGDVLVAEEVDIKKRGGGEDEKFELEGDIESADAGQRTFVLRGETVTWDERTNFKHGSPNQIEAGVKVEIKGVLTNNGTQLYATRIEFAKKGGDDDDGDDGDDDDD
jgi:hypothetical protein